MTAILETKLAVEGIKIALDLVKSIRGEKPSNVDEKLSELSASILNAQQHAVSAYARETELIQRIRELEQALTDREEWRATKAKYELKRVGDGSYAYMLKENTDTEDGAHHLCQKCYEDGQMSVLQWTGNFDHGMIHQCHRCKGKVIIA